MKENHTKCFRFRQSIYLCVLAFWLMSTVLLIVQPFLLLLLFTRLWCDCITSFWILYFCLPILVVQRALTFDNVFRFISSSNVSSGHYICVTMIHLVMKQSDLLTSSPSGNRRINSSNKSKIEEFPINFWKIANFYDSSALHAKAEVKRSNAYCAMHKWNESLPTITFGLAAGYLTNMTLFNTADCPAAPKLTFSRISINL